MQSSHFLMNFIRTYHEVASAAGVSVEEFAAGARRMFFNEDEPPASPMNFSTACEIICEVRLPRERSLASVSVSAPYQGDRLVYLRAGASSSYAGRKYLEQLTRDTALALKLFDLISEAARSFDFEINDS